MDGVYLIAVSIEMEAVYIIYFFSLTDECCNIGREHLYPLFIETLVFGLQVFQHDLDIYDYKYPHLDSSSGFYLTT